MFIPRKVPLVSAVFGIDRALVELWAEAVVVWVVHVEDGVAGSVAIGVDCVSNCRLA